ncbi:MAG: class I SAM-dependent methyltransferase [Holosporales bacterium]|jgi:SAM-dependent methyltransferase|nr:class I SAM-dependent methyltransferase [Holosporales bacterium]
MKKVLDSPVSATFSSEMAHACHYNAWVLSIFQPYLRGALLEIGVAHGSFYDLLPSGIRYTGLDIEPCYVAQAQQRGRQAFVADIADSRSLQGRGPFETILCFNVLEHVFDDRKALQNLGTLLREGGHVCLFIPAFPVLFGPMDALAGHHRRYTKASLRAIFPDGLQLEKMVYFNFIGGLGWALNKGRKPRTLDDTAINAQIRIFDRYILPLSRALQPVTQAFFGQSLACVLKKVPYPP